MEFTSERVFGLGFGPLRGRFSNCEVNSGHRLCPRGAAFADIVLPTGRFREAAEGEIGFRITDEIGRGENRRLPGESLRVASIAGDQAWRPGGSFSTFRMA